VAPRCEDTKLIIHAIITPTVHQRHGRRDGWTDRRTIYDTKQKNKCGGPLYPVFLQQHGPHRVVNIREGARHTLASGFHVIRTLSIPRFALRASRRNNCNEMRVALLGGELWSAISVNYWLHSRRKLETYTSPTGLK